MRISPLWPKLKALAPTPPYDALLTVPHQQGRVIRRSDWADIHQRTLVLAGGQERTVWMKNGMKALASLLPDAQYQELDRQTHNLRPSVVAPELAAFFSRA